MINYTIWLNYIFALWRGKGERNKFSVWKKITENKTTKDMFTLLEILTYLCPSIFYKCIKCLSE